MTTPYVTGTVTVTAGSAVVTGTGTGWLTSGLVAGQFGVDGLSVPVLSIDTDTKITLAKPWPGATASGKAYWITYDTTPGQQTVANAQRLAEYIARLDKPALAALASLVPAADKLPYFGAGGAGALADFNAAARALLAGGVLPNAQFPERLRSLTDPKNNVDTISENGFFSATGQSSGVPYSGGAWLIHSHFWSDANFAVQDAYNLFNSDGAFRRFKVSGSWTAWFSAGAKSVGTVVQSGGLSTGAIIERGSNANGEYTRFADGTQICSKTVIMTGLDQKRLYAGWNFPASFLGNPKISSLVNLATFISAGFPISNAGAINYTSFIDLTNSSCVMNVETIYAGASTGVGVVSTHCTAIGRWF